MTIFIFYITLLKWFHYLILLSCFYNLFFKENIYKNKQIVKKQNKENKENELVEEECKNKFKFSKRISHFNDKRFDKNNFSLVIFDNLNEECFYKSDNNENDVDLNSEEAIDDEHNNKKIIYNIINNMNM